MNRPVDGDMAKHGETRDSRSEEHTSELQSRLHLVCRLLLEKKKNHMTYLRLRTHTAVTLDVDTRPHLLDQLFSWSLRTPHAAIPHSTLDAPAGSRSCDSHTA